MPEPSIIHKLVQDVKLSFAATPAPAAPMRDVGSPEEYQALPKIVPLGSTSKMLSKGQKSATVDRSSDPSGSADQSGMHGNNLFHGMQGMSGMNGLPVGIMQFASMMSLLVNSHKHGHEVQHDNPQPASKKQGALALADAGPRKPYGENLPLTEKASMQLELANFQTKLRSKAKPDSSPEGPEEEKQDDPAEKTCAAAEQAAFEALKNRSTKKQEAQKDSTAAGKSKGKGEKDKGEQNKGKGMKRPAAAMAKTEEEFQYECPSPGSTWVTRNKESWKSKHYHSAREPALKCERLGKRLWPVGE